MKSAHVEALFLLDCLHQADKPWHRKGWWAKDVAKYAADRKLELSLLHAFSYEIVFVTYISF